MEKNDLNVIRSQLATQLKICIDGNASDNVIAGAIEKLFNNPLCDNINCVFNYDQDNYDKDNCDQDSCDQDSCSCSVGIESIILTFNTDFDKQGNVIDQIEYTVTKITDEIIMLLAYKCIRDKVDLSMTHAKQLLKRLHKPESNSSKIRKILNNIETNKAFSTMIRTNSSIIKYDNYLNTYIQVCLDILTKHGFNVGILRQYAIHGYCINS